MTDPQDAGDSGRAVALGRTLVCAIWLLLACWQITNVPGMAMDEAWSILSARGQWAPSDPLSGMTRYAGPFPVLLLKLFGTEHGRGVLRGASILCNTAALLLLFRVLGKLHPARSLRVWSWALVATIPAWLVLLRVGIEVSMFGPLLALAAIYLLLVQKPSATFGAGLCFGLLAYNHALGAFVPMSLLASWWLVYRGLPLISWRHGFLGLAIGLAPRVLALCLYEAPVDDAIAKYKLGGALLDLVILPGALWSTLNGTAVYLNYAGREVVTVLPYWLLAIGMLMPWRGRMRTLPRAARVTFFASSIMAVLGTVAAPNLATRYLLYPTIGFSICVVQLGASAIESDARRLATTRFIAGAMVFANLFYLAVNYYVPWYRQDLGVEYFWFGFRNKKESNRVYLPKTDLVETLRLLKPAQVLASPSIERPLRALFTDATVRIGSPQTSDDRLRPTVLVTYYEKELPRTKCVESPSGIRCLSNPVIVDNLFTLYQ